MIHSTTVPQDINIRISYAIMLQADDDASLALARMLQQEDQQEAEDERHREHAQEMQRMATVHRQVVSSMLRGMQEIDVQHVLHGA